MAEPRRINRVHRSLSRPLTILGAERKLFFFAMCLGAATFNLLEQSVRRVADVFVAVLFRPLGHPNRPADPAFSADGRKASPAVRPDEIQPHSSAKGWSCSGLVESSRTTTRPARSASRSISTDSLVRTFFSPRAAKWASSSKCAAWTTSVLTTLRLMVSPSASNRR